jgi:hypothetical protein
MLQYVEEMQARLTEVTRNEQTLIRTLGEALARVDQELLADVRDLTLSHEARRVAILQELQCLASRIGAFPVAPEPAQVTAAPLPPSPEAEDPPRAGDWRQAVSNIKDELDVYFGRDQQH